jgi:hypothetical protein
MAKKLITDRCVITHGRSCSDCRFINICKYWEQLEGPMNTFINYCGDTWQDVGRSARICKTTNTVLAMACKYFTRKEPDENQN